MLNEEGLKAAAKAIHGSNVMQPVAGPWLEDGSVSEKFATQAAAAAITAYLSTVEKPVAVKKLEWSHVGKVPDGPWSETRLHQVRGHHNLGRYAGSYTVQEMEAGGKWGWWNTWTSDREPEGIEATEDEAKAAAQADFEARILSALVIPTPPASATKGE